MNRMHKVVWLSVCLVMLVVSQSQAAESLARLMPQEAAAYTELRSVKPLFDLVEKWGKKIGGPDQGGIDEQIGQLAQELGMDPKALRTDLGNIKGAALAFWGIDAEKNQPLMLVVGDLSDSPAFLDALVKKTKAEFPEPAETYAGVPIYGGGEDEPCVCFIDKHVFLTGKIADLKAAIDRMKGGGANLTQVALFQKTMKSAAVDAVSVSYVDVQRLRLALEKIPGNADEVRAVDVALDLKTVDSVVSSLRITQDRVLSEGSVFLNGINRSYETFRMKMVLRSTSKFLSKDYGLVTTGALIDGKQQFNGFKDLVTRTLMAADQKDDADQFVAGIAAIEDGMKIKMEDEIANVEEYGVGIKMGAAGMDGNPDLLFVLKVKDAQRAAGVMKKVEEVAKAEMEDLEIREKDVDGVKVRFIPPDIAESDYAWAVVGDYVLLSNRTKPVEEAIRTFRAGKGIFDDERTKQVLAELHNPNAKVLLVNPVGLMGRANPNAPAPGMIAITTAEAPLRLDIKCDLTHVDDLAQMVVGMFMGAMMR